MRPSAGSAPLGAALLLVLVAAGPAAPGGSRQTGPITSDPARAAFMRAHFARVTEAHDAIVRGDLDAARTSARTLADEPDPERLPAAAAPYVVSMRRAASRAAASQEAEDVAAAVAAMLATCGDCHRVAGTMPAIARPPAVPEVGGVVGHMLAHRTAADLMVQGLTTPSATLWEEGARALEGAALSRKELPRDRRLTREIAEEEERVHDLARRARGAPDQRARVYFYGELVLSCHTCHALHRNVWGPDERK